MYRMFDHSSPKPKTLADVRAELEQKYGHQVEPKPKTLADVMDEVNNDSVRSLRP